MVLRVFNPIGPGRRPASLPGRLAAELRARPAADAPRCRGWVTSSAHRDFVDVRDVARAAGLAATAPGRAPAAVLNIGSGRARPVRDAGRRAGEGRAASSGRSRTAAAVPAALGRRAAGSKRTSVAAGRLLGWQPPRTAFAELA